MAAILCAVNFWGWYLIWIFSIIYLLSSGFKLFPIFGTILVQFKQNRTWPVPPRHAPSGNLWSPLYKIFRQMAIKSNIIFSAKVSFNHSPNIFHRRFPSFSWLSLWYWRSHFGRADREIHFRWKVNKSLHNVMLWISSAVPGKTLTEKINSVTDGAD